MAEFSTSVEPATVPFEARRFLMDLARSSASVRTDWARVICELSSESSWVPKVEFSPCSKPAAERNSSIFASEPATFFRKSSICLAIQSRAREVGCELASVVEAM